MQPLLDQQVDLNETHHVTESQKKTMNHHDHIVELLSRNESMSIQDIAEKLGVSIGHALTELNKSSDFERCEPASGQGFYWRISFLTQDPKLAKIANRRACVAIPEAKPFRIPRENRPPWMVEFLTENPGEWTVKKIVEKTGRKLNAVSSRVQFLKEKLNIRIGDHRELIFSLRDVPAHK